MLPTPAKLLEWCQQSSFDDDHVPSSYHKERLPELAKTLQKHIHNTPVHSRTQLYELSADLITLELSELALELLEHYPEFSSQESGDIHALMFEGTVFLRAGDLEKSELCFKKAHHLVPSEPAPFVNLVEIFFAKKNLPEAKKWLLAGLNTEPNYPRLWEQYYLLTAEEQPDLGQIAQHIEHTAHQKNSWYGGCVALEVRHSEEPEERVHELKVEHLNSFYNKGEQGEDFLIEYTGYLGASGRYNQLLQVIWQTKSPTSPLPWKLGLHNYQALSALGKDQEAANQKNQLLSHPDLPPEVRSYLAPIS